MTSIWYDGDLDWEILGTGELMVMVPRKQDRPEKTAYAFTLQMEHVRNTLIDEEPKEMDSGFGQNRYGRNMWKNLGMKLYPYFFPDVKINFRTKSSNPM